jgi:hypothetical protein
MIEIQACPPSHVRRIWPLVDKYVADALVFTRGAWLPEDVCDACEKGNMQLWLATRGDEVLAALVSEITDYPRRRIIGVPFIGGKEMRQWFRKALATIEAWSKEMGCSGLQGGARRGWAKLAKMDEIGVILWKDYDLGAPLGTEQAPAREEMH